MPTIAVKEEVLEELRRAVMDKHGKVYSHLREEAEIALKEHIAKMREESPPRSGGRRTGRTTVQIERERHFPELDF